MMNAINAKDCDISVGNFGIWLDAFPDVSASAALAG